MKNFFILLSIILTNYTFGQFGQVNYQYTDALIIGNAIGEKYNAYLKFNSLNSEFVVKKDGLEKNEDVYTSRTYENDEKTVGYISPGLMVLPNGFQVITDFNKNIMYSNIYLRNHIYVEEKIPMLKWKINNENSKVIQGYKCIMATTTFRGRNYIAWFTKEIPKSSGPWKLQGLPGLILEAYDDKKHVFWQAESVIYGKNAIEVKKYLVDESLEPQKDFLSLDEYEKKLKELIISMNYNNMKKSSSLGHDAKPILSSSIFIEVFEK